MGSILSYLMDTGQLQETIFPGSTARNAAVRTQDYSSNYGGAIPISQGLRRISGVPIWMGPLKDDKILGGFSGGFSVGYTASNIDHVMPSFSQQIRSLTRDFAVAFGYNLAPLNEIDLPKVRRVWVNGTLAFANGSTVQPIYFDPTTKTYSASFGKVAAYSGVLYGTTTGAPPSELGINNPAFFETYQANINFSFYAGTETQMPDATIKADKGDLTPAYRGMIYMVIKNLPVGTATDTNRFMQFNDGTGAWGFDRSVDIPNALPKIDVELVDGTTISNTIQNFELLPEAVDSEFAAQILMPNWDKRQITVLNKDIGIQTYDMDAKAEIEVIPFVKDFPDDAFGDNGAFTVWDTVNDLIYSHDNRSTGYGILSACDRKTGIIYRAPWSSGFNLGFKDIDGGNPFTTGKPVDVVPTFTKGDIAHFLFSGEVLTAIYGAEFYGASCVVVPSNNGQDWPLALPANALHDYATRYVNSIQALPLLMAALEAGAQPSQDVCFVACAENKAFLVYVTFERYILDIGGTPVSRVWGKIAGVKQVYEAGDPACQVWAVVTSERDILICNYNQDRNGVVVPGQTSSIAKLKITYDTSPDYVAAPGWKGYFPHETLVYDTPQPSDVLLPPSDMRKNSNTINGEYLFQYVGSTYHINTDDGSAFVEDNVAYATKLSMIWDGATRTVYGHDTNLQYCELGRAITGTVGLLKDYLRWFGLRAGFTAANISVDTKIDDQVVGSIIVTTMDMAQLFNDLGKLYGFIWFVSGSTLKFVKNNQAPIKASATLTISSQPTDGSTVTIGAAVYTFKLIPAAPYDVKIDSAAKETTLINLMKAINASGEDGFEYFSVTAAHPDVLATCPTDTTLKATAKIGGTAANSITVARSGSGLSWGGATTLSGGDVPPAAAINLTLDNMMAVQASPVGEDAALITTFPSVETATQAAEVLYYNLDADYAPSSQKFVPDDGSDASGLYNIQTYDTTFVMAASEAYSRVTKVGAVNNTGVDITQEFQLSQQFLRAEPSDIVSITIGTYNYTVRLDEVTFNGDYTISVAGVNYSFRDDIPVVVYLPPTRPEQTIAGPGDGMPGVFDTPFIDVAQGGGNATDFVVYSGVKTYGQAGWLSAQMSRNGSIVYTTAVDIPYGTASMVLPDTATPYLTDNTTVLRVAGKSMIASDLANATDDQFYNNENMLIVGKPGRWEYVAFKSVTALNSKVFEFSGLARGRRGTDVNVGNHVVNDEVYLVKSVAAGFNNPLQLQYFDETVVNTDDIYSVAGLPASRAPSSLTVTYTGESLKPFSPCDLAAALVAGNDIDLTWNRRDRLSNVFITDTPPLSETSEKYDLEIFSAGVVVRTLTDLTTPSYTYVSADQTTDGFTPPLASLEIRVYQKGELGRGYPKQETLNVE